MIGMVSRSTPAPIAGANDLTSLISLISDKDKFAAELARLQQARDDAAALIEQANAAVALHNTREKAIDAREAELAQRAADLDKRECEMDEAQTAREAEIIRRGAEQDERTKALDEREASLRNQQTILTAAQARIAETRKALEGV